MKSIRRKKVFTYFHDQAKLAGIFVLWAFILILTVVALFFVTYSNTSTQADSLPVHEQLFAKMLLIEQAQHMATMFGATVLAFLILMGGYIMIYTHRLTGPVYKLRKTLEEATANSAWPKPISFRKKDSFHDLAKAFNKYIETMKGS